jgi:hypothetical protein
MKSEKIYLDVCPLLQEMITSEKPALFCAGFTVKRKYTSDK